jgi:NAD(P)-dependent dehydrogenase (short-subunit alcohol dehydrogenase family)
MTVKRSGKEPRARAIRAARLDGKVCLITGAGSGIGRAIAEAMAREGGIVGVSDVDLEAAKAVADEICATQGVAEGIELDVAREDDWQRAIATVVKVHGRLDVLVNNAGVALGGPIVDTTLEDWRWVMSVNLDGAFLGVKHAIQAMRKRGGSIVNISSALACVGRPLIGAVAASKAGVVMLTKTAALECAHRRWNIRVNAVLPGGVDTQVFKGQSWWPHHRSDARREADARRDIVDDTPLGRLARPQEIAGAVVYLASDEASFVTGATLAIDGGFTAG